MVNQDRIGEDFYPTLGVSKDASAGDIKKAYHKLTRKYHPDRNPGDSAVGERFKEVGETYQVLSNGEDRKQYDAIHAFGAGGARFTAGGGGGAGFEDMFSSMFGGSGGSFRRYAQRANASSGGFENIFNMFGGSGGGGPRFSFGSSRRASRDKDLVASVSIPLRQAASGTAVKITTASGRSIMAKIPTGVTDGQKIHVPGESGASINGGPGGDILATVNIEKHPVYELKGKGVYVNVPISFSEATLGATVKIPTLDGKTVSIRIPEGSSTDKLLRVCSEGPKGGDIYTRLRVVVPKKFSEDARRAVEELTDATGDADPHIKSATLARS